MHVLSTQYFLPIPREGLLALLWWTVMLAFVITAGYYWVKMRLGRASKTAKKADGPSQMRVVGLFVMVAILVFGFLLATHLVPAT